MADNSLKAKQHKEFQNLIIKIISVVVVFIGIYIARSSDKINNSFIGIIILACIFFLIFFDGDKPEVVEEKKSSSNEDKEKEEKEKLEAYNRNLPIFLDEARNSYYKKLVSEGFSLDSYLDDSPFEICGFNEGLKMIPKWEVYELYIKNFSDYRDDIIKKCSGSKVNFSVLLYSVKYDNYGYCVDWKTPNTGISRALENYSYRLYNRSFDERKKDKEVELKAREKYKSIF